MHRNLASDALDPAEGALSSEVELVVEGRPDRTLVARTGHSGRWRGPTTKLAASDAMVREGRFVSTATVNRRMRRSAR